MLPGVQHHNESSILSVVLLILLLYGKGLLISINNRNLSQNKSVRSMCNKMEESKRNHSTQSGTIMIDTSLLP